MMSVQTTEDGTDSSLPSFSTFSAELDPSWDYYDRDRSSSDVITSQQSNNYTRPWEMDTKDKGFEPFSKLPSFQSQFHSYAEANMMPEPSLPHLTPVPVPISPNSHGTPSNGSLTQLTSIHPLQNGLAPLSTPSFHTLTAVNTRPYPLVPAPIQARDIPGIQQQYIDERHIQLYQPMSAYPPPPPQSHAITVIKNEPANYELKNGLHHNTYVTPMHHENGYDTNIKIEKAASPMPMRPTPTEARKKDRRKVRASSLESSAESESSAMDIGDGNSGQVAAVSSTASFKSPMIGNGNDDDHNDKQVGYCDGCVNPAVRSVTNAEHFCFFAYFIFNQTKKKRKRCGECIGCQKKDNCGDCAPCRNDKSHQICKQRRCEKLTDKKVSPNHSPFSFYFIFVGFLTNQNDQLKHLQRVQLMNFLISSSLKTKTKIKLTLRRAIVIPEQM